VLKEMILKGKKFRFQQSLDSKLVKFRFYVSKV